MLLGLDEGAIRREDLAAGDAYDYNPATGAVGAGPARVIANQ